MPFALAALMLAPVFADLLKRLPDLDLVLDVDNHRIDIAAEEVDVALRLGPLPDSGLVARNLVDFELWTCASPSCLAAHVSRHRP